MLISNQDIRSLDWKNTQATFYLKHSSKGLICNLFFLAVTRQLIYLRVKINLTEFIYLEDRHLSHRISLIISG